MILQDIQIGTRLELELLNKNNEKVGNAYISQLLEHQENNLMVISAPIFEARLIFIPLQSQLQLIFMHPEYGLLCFSALVTGSELRGKIAVLIVQPEGDLAKAQRRNHYRLGYMTDVLIWLPNKGPDADNRTVVKAFTKNISGSGACIVSEVDIPKKSIVDIELNLTGRIKINAKCTIVRNAQFVVKKTKRYELGLHFVDISRSNQESLVKFIFEQQRVQLKKGTHL